MSFPRTDLKIPLDGIELKPAFAFGSWLAFKKEGDQVVAMGDLVVTDAEVGPVTKALTESGIEVTGIHNHLLRGTPSTMYVHVLAQGDPAKLASDFRQVLEQSGTPLSEAEPSQDSANESPELYLAGIDEALGHRGKMQGGIYQVSIPRASLVKEAGMEVPAAMGSAIAINFQPLGNQRAAITGDFVLTADEVNPVLAALRENGIEVTALHNHMLTEEPRLFFMHFWQTVTPLSSPTASELRLRRCGCRRRQVRSCRDLIALSDEDRFAARRPHWPPRLFDTNNIWRRVECKGRTKGCVAEGGHVG